MRVCSGRRARGLSRWENLVNQVMMIIEGEATTGKTRPSCGFSTVYRGYSVDRRQAQVALAISFELTD